MSACPCCIWCLLSFRFPMSEVIAQDVINNKTEKNSLEKAAQAKQKNKDTAAEKKIDPPIT